MEGEFARVGVVGLGTMGAGIVEVFARAGLEVIGVELSAELLQRGRDTVEGSTAKAVERGKLDEEERQAILARVAYADAVRSLADCDLVVEAIVERLDVKAELFAELDDVVPAHGVLATNTSSLSVTAVAAATSRPDRVVGMHFFNPAPVLKLVEVVRGVETDPDVAASVAGLAERLGKTPIACDDRAGFIANSLLFGYLNHAVALYDAGVARDELDAAVVAGAGFPMGPLALLDLIGLDTAKHILDVMYAETGILRHVPHPLLVRLVAAGRLGRKSGRGFYSYARPGSGRLEPDPETTESGADAGNGRDVASVAVVAGAGNREEPEGAPGGVADALRSALAGAGCDIVPDAEASRADAVVWCGRELGGGDERFAELAAAARPGAVLLSAVTDVSVAELAATCDRPADVAGLVFSGTTPGAVAEVVRTVATADEVAHTAAALAERIGAVVVHRGDRTGGVVDALVYGYIGDGVRMRGSGYADADAIDQALTLGCRLPGPFALLAQVGARSIQQTLARMYAETGDPGLAPSPLLRELGAVSQLSAASPLSGVRTHRRT